MSPTSSSSSWNEAHSQYCRKHNVLRASVENVVKDVSNQGEYELPWEVPSLVSVATKIEDLGFDSKQEQKQGTKEEESESLSSRWQRLASSLVSMFFQDELELSNEWQQSNDDALQEGESSSSLSSSSLNWKVPIIHVEYTKSCIQAVQRDIQTNANHSFFLLKRSEWRRWCSERESPDNNAILFSKLSSEDLDWILHILIEKKQAKLIQRENLDDLIVMSTTSSLNSDNNEEEETKQLEIAVALHDLRTVSTTLEEQVKEWEKFVYNCRQRAKNYKERKQTSLALLEMKKSKLFQDRIDQSTHALLNLEQTHATIEMTQSNQVILELLSKSSQTLRGLTQQIPLDRIEEIKEDLQIETDRANEVQESLTTSDTITISEEEALLKELESLTIDETKKIIQTEPVAKDKEDLVPHKESKPSLTKKVPVLA